MQAGNVINVSCQVKDSRRNDLAAGTLGYIMKPADIVRGQGVNLTEWTIVQEDLILSADDASGILGAVGAALNVLGL